MFFKQLIDPELGCASYILGCPGAGEGIIVDPLEHLGQEAYALEASEQGLAISHVIDTHIHADHVSIGPELARRVGAEYNMYATSEVALQFVPLHDGDVISFGTVEVTVAHTPGHTPESLSLLVTDRSRSEEPWMILTGDSLFVGDVARPDLLLGAKGEESSEERAGKLYDTMKWFLAQPDYLEIFPGHYGASTCGGADMSAKTSSTIGFERRHNKALQPDTKTAFVSRVLDHLRPFPDQYQQIKRMNRGERERRNLDHPADFELLEPHEVASRTAPVLDVRPVSDYAQEHIPESINVPYVRQGFGDQVEDALESPTTVVLVAENDLVAGAAAKEIKLHGHKIKGLLRGGLSAWKAAGKDIATFKDVTPDELHRRFGQGDQPVVIDVRESWEFEQGHIPGAKLHPLGSLPDAAKTLNPDARYVVACATGNRSSRAQAFLHRKGFQNVENLTGGTSLWRSAGYPVER